VKIIFRRLSIQIFNTGRKFYPADVRKEEIKSWWVLTILHSFYLLPIKKGGESLPDP
jgi:hypothetical protein